MAIFLVSALEIQFIFTGVKKHLHQVNVVAQTLSGVYLHTISIPVMFSVPERARILIRLVKPVLTVLQKYVKLMWHVAVQQAIVNNQRLAS